MEVFKIVQFDLSEFDTKCIHSHTKIIINHYIGLEVSKKPLNLVINIGIRG